MATYFHAYIPCPNLPLWLLRSRATHKTTTTTYTIQMILILFITIVQSIDRINIIPIVFRCHTDQKTDKLLKNNDLEGRGPNPFIFNDLHILRCNYLGIDIKKKGVYTLKSGVYSYSYGPKTKPPDLIRLRKGGKTIIFKTFTQLEHLQSRLTVFDLSNSLQQTRRNVQLHQSYTNFSEELPVLLDLLQSLQVVACMCP